MRKILTLLLILSVGVICSACVNTFAVHELNQLAIDYMNKGDIDSAISRLEASIDLDSDIFDTRYNLALAYLKKNDCMKAKEHITVAKKLNNNNEAEVYYTSGVINNCLATNIFEKTNEDGEVEEIVYENPEENAIKQNEFIELLELANKDLTEYSILNPTSDEIDEIKVLIDSNKSRIEESKTQIK